MTTTNRHPSPSANPNPSPSPPAASGPPDGLAADDPRAVFARAVATGGAVVGAVRADQLDAPTPCDEFDVRGLLGHLVSVLRRVAAMGRGESPFTVPDVTGVADDGWSDAWRAAAHDVQRAWSDDATLAREVRLPWGTFDGAGVLANYANELTVHTWDLAVATGQHPAWDERVLEVAYDSIRSVLPAEGRRELFAAVRAGMPADRRVGGDPFAERVAVADDAPLVDRLVAWNGRRP